MERDLTIALFVHLLGVMGLFSGVTMELVASWGVHQAQSVSAVRVWAPIAKFGGQLIPIAALLILFSGVYMVEDVWSWDHTWIVVSLAFFIALFAAGPGVNARRSKAIFQAAFTSPDGPVPGHLARLIHDPVLGISERVMTASSVGLVYLMAVKPGALETIVAMAVSVAAGLAAALPQLRALGEDRAAQTAPDVIN